MRPAVLLLLGVAACGHSAAVPAGPPVTTPPPSGGLAVQAWVTTGDQAKLLSHDPDNYFVAGQTATGTVITLDEGTTYQQVIGFGAAVTDASAYLMQEKMSAAQRETLLQDLFGRTTGIGLSFTRLPMGASDFSLSDYSYDDMPSPQTDSALAHFSIDPDRADRLPVLKRALAINPQLTIMANPWSPPGWMKTTGSMIGGTLLPRFYDSFAQYFVKFVQAYAAEGVPIYAISIQNEPHYEPPSYPGMLVDPPTRAAVIGGHVGPQFAAAGLHTLIWDWDHNWDMPQEPLGVLGDATARQYIQGIAWHCYAGDVSAQTTVHAQYPDKDVYFTECSGGDWAPTFSSNLTYFVGTLIIGTTQNWARGVLLWNLALDEHDGPHTGGCGNCRGVVTVNSTSGVATHNVEYFALAHASKFVRPGAVHIGATQPGGLSAGGLSTVAFKNSDDGSKALIVLNSGGQPAAFTVRWSGKTMSYTLPAASVVTFAWP